VAEAEQVDVSGDRLQRRAQLVTHASQELDLGAAHALGGVAGPLGIYGAPRVLYRQHDEPGALLDEPDHLAVRAARVPEHHRELADDALVDADQRNDLDGPEAERM